MLAIHTHKRIVHILQIQNPLAPATYNIVQRVRDNFSQVNALIHKRGFYWWCRHDGVIVVVVVGGGEGV